MIGKQARQRRVGDRVERLTAEGDPNRIEGISIYKAEQAEGIILNYKLFRVFLASGAILE